MKEYCLRWLIVFMVIGTMIGKAQNTGKIAGKVFDATTGEPLVGANVIVEGTSLGAATDINGEFTIIKIPSGKYSIAVSYLGYQKLVITNVQVLNDLTTHLDCKLTESSVALEREIVVVAESPLIKKDLTSTEARVTADEIKNMPVQNLDQLIIQQAGVTKDAGGGFHIRGGRSTEISYLVNGVSITDDFYRSQAFTIATESIQELQVISGTFNAEYGNAMSGVVNVVTKTGSTKFQSTVELWSGDYISTHKDIFWGIDKLSPTANYILQASFGGPLFIERATYWVALRKSHNDGYLYGIAKYNPEGRARVVGGVLVPNPGDSSFVSMNWSDQFNGQATVDVQLTGTMKLKIDAFGSRETNRYYTHLYRLNPRGEKGGKSTGWSILGRITHQLWETTFQEFTIAKKYNEYNSALYDNPYDSRYVHADSLTVPGYHFYTAGTNLNRFERNTQSIIAKWDITSQINKYNLVKCGAELQADRVFYENINLVAAKNASGQDIVPFVPMIQGIESSNHDRFVRKPVRFAAYIQDKLEFESVIINVGVRYEMFDPKGKRPADREDPNIYNPYKLEHMYKDLNGDGKIGLEEQTETNKFTLAEREKFWYKPTTIKKQISPRFGISYPITDKGIIRFSYGIFQQIPEYSQLYLGDEFKLTSAQGIQGPFGNNDLKPQRTTIYEIGLQQQLSDDYAIDVTAFYRDIRDWISSSQPIQTFLAGISYSERINRDFANVRGITCSINKRFSNAFAFGIDYTYQIAEGTNSSPDEEFFAQQNGSEPKRLLAPLAWDQRHTLNANLFVGNDLWGASVLGNFSSGQPYTPTLIQGSITGKDVMAGLATNSLRKPSLFRVDFELYRNWKIFSVNLQLFVKIFNLFDAKNPLYIYTDTGRPDFTIEQVTVSDYDEGWFVNPSFYSEPRSIYVGTKISL